MVDGLQGAIGLRAARTPGKRDQSAGRRPSSAHRAQQPTILVLGVGHADNRDVPEQVGCVSRRHVDRLEWTARSARQSRSRRNLHDQHRHDASLDFHGRPWQLHRDVHAATWRFDIRYYSTEQEFRSRIAPRLPLAILAVLLPVCPALAQEGPETGGGQRQTEHQR